MAPIDMEMWQDFVVEAQENLDEFEPNLLLLEQQPEDTSILNDCFRNMHSIKGAANYMGLERIATLSHRMESLFDAVRQGRISLKAEAFDLIFSCVDRLKALIEDVSANQQETLDISDLVSALDAYINKNEGREVASQEQEGTESGPKEVSSVQETQELEPEEVWDEDQELLAIFREEMKSLFSQLKSLLEQEGADADGVSKVLEDMERVTNYVGQESLSTFLKGLHQEISEKDGDRDLLSDSGALLIQKIAQRLESELGLPIDLPSSDQAQSSGLMEDDPELYEIFMDFFSQAGRPLAKIPETLDADYLTEAVKSASKLKNSAHYMDYTQVVELLDKWEAEAKRLLEEKGADQEDRELFVSLWEQLTEILPDLKGLFDHEKSLAEGQEVDSSPVDQDAVQEPLEELIAKEVEDAFDGLAGAFTEQAETETGQAEDAAAKPPAEEPASKVQEDKGVEELADDMAELDSAIDSLFDSAAAESPASASVEAAPSAPPREHEKEMGRHGSVSPEGPSGMDPLADHQGLAEKAAAPAAPSGPGDLIKVDLSKVESLLGDVGELVVLRSSLVQASEQLKNIYNEWLTQRLLSTSELRPLKEILLKVSENASALERVVHQLQDGVMRIRMLPVSTIFNRYPRMVRDLSRRLRKQVELTIYGGDTSLDKQVMEQLADPMQHLVRNALDHGIEPPQERLRKGKPAQGRLVISASQEGNNVVIMVSDDGRGLNREAIIKKAVEKGIIRPAEAQALTAGQVWNLIFLPGMTTADKVSDISGRGVGLDVVRSNIERMGGSISVNSEPGKGTIFMLRIPLTLAIIKGLVVRVGAQAMVVPVAAVQETFRVSPDEISHIEGYEIISLRQQTMPLIRLGKIFRGTGSTGDSNRIFAIRISQGDDEVCLGVDELLGQQEVVIKPLSEYLTDQPGFSGATVLGDGSIALILDLPAMLQKARAFVKKRQELMEQEALGLSGTAPGTLSIH